MSWPQVAMSRPLPSLPSLQILLKSMKIKQSPLKALRIHVLASIANVQASPHPAYFSKPVGTVPNAMYDGNQYAKKEIGGRGGADKYNTLFNTLLHKVSHFIYIRYSIYISNI